MEESILSPQWRKNNIAIFAKKLNEKLKTSYIVSGITIIIALIAMYIVVDRFFQSSTIILSMISVVIGIFAGTIITIKIIYWYFNEFCLKENKDMGKDYSKMVIADIERTKKVFQNKNWQLKRVPDITFIEHWTLVLSNLSGFLTMEEIKEYVEYYSSVESIIELQEDINRHIKFMKKVPLSEYNHMKEYKEMYNLFNMEINKLFNVNTEKLTLKLMNMAA